MSALRELAEALHSIDLVGARTRFTHEGCKVVTHTDWDSTRQCLNECIELSAPQSHMPPLSLADEPGSKVVNLGRNWPRHR